ncbi:fluoride efflux transporter CrcB [Jannaschia sp. 2305UL9-9]|uniref:fluoride efflux transporter CrcB n=1 Tax=Jannaschia sp. 2305UL9-9 TaxID=3121638 RepID=UPI0035293085
MAYTLLTVALGGALGASLRAWIGLMLVRDGFPVAVLTVNVLGSFAMGVLFVVLSRHGLPQWQPFLMTGVLGGFTTFSAFSLETLMLVERGAWGQAGAYVGLSVGLSVAALAAGLWIARSFA